MRMLTNFGLIIGVTSVLYVAVTRGPSVFDLAVSVMIITTFWIIREGAING